MEVLSDHNWVLTVGTFLPLVGVLIMLFIPKADEALSKAVAIGTAALIVWWCHSNTAHDSCRPQRACRQPGAREALPRRGRA